MATPLPRVFVALPVRDELRRLPILLSCLCRQSLKSFELWACVNQDDDCDGSSEACLSADNQAAMELLRQPLPFPVRIIDRCSPGKRFERRGAGVGLARREIMDAVSAEARERDIIISMDADVVLGPRYIEEVAGAFDRFRSIFGLLAPYMHPLTGSPSVDRAILRYEIYLRTYACNLFRIGSPYAMTALGSAIALTVDAYRKVGGVPVREAGEDFYLAQKLIKHGQVLRWLDCRVYPSARISCRVPFGTGPAVLRGTQGDFGACPIFPCEAFDDVGRTTALFRRLYEEDVHTPLTPFLSECLGIEDPWGPLRRNHTHPDRFEAACHQRLDGLRILQYLRRFLPPPSDPPRSRGAADQWNLARFLGLYHMEELSKRASTSPALQEAVRLVKRILSRGFTSLDPDRALLVDAPVERLQALRLFLMEMEDRARKEHAKELLTIGPKRHEKAGRLKAEEMESKTRLICILGPTASGKTALSAALAAEIDAEVISADSRQVYRGMDIGTGKDLDEYEVGGISVPYHLIDILDPEEPFSVFHFKKAFIKAFDEIERRRKKAVLCGGTGLYLESVLLDYRLDEVDFDAELRKRLSKMSREEKVAHLASLRALHNTTDVLDEDRLERAIEIAERERANQDPVPTANLLPKPAEIKVFGVRFDRKTLKERITRRLRERLDGGMIQEVELMLQKGVDRERMEYFGLEYRFVARHLLGELSRNDMYQKLNSAIHGFAKRQQTFFRRMERRGVEIDWIEGELSLMEKVALIRQRVRL